MIGTIHPTPKQRLIAPFKPLPWQIAPWRDKSKVLLLTGSAGGGKSRLAAEKVHAFCLKYPGSTGLILRKTRESLTNSAVLIMDRRIIAGHPQVRHVSSKSRFEYANGSILAYGGMKNEEQREQIRSIGLDGGVDIAWMEEAIQFDEEDMQEVLPRLRGKAAPWVQLLLSTNPDAPLHWIKRRLIDNEEAAVYFSQAADNPYNPDSYHETLGLLTGAQRQRLVDGLWSQAEGLVYDVWSDGPDDGSVTKEAEYIPDSGSVVWAVDDGYAGEIDPKTGTFTPESHPRVFLLCQLRANGTLCIFAEHYAIKTLSDKHIDEVLALPYPLPDYAAVDKSAAELKGRLHAKSLYTRNSPPSVEESIKELQRRLAKDTNGVRLVLVHPRCYHLRREMASYSRNKLTGQPIKQFDHGPDALRYLNWTLRNA